MSEPAHRNVVEDTISRLMAYIERGEFAAGGRLPGEPALAKQLGVSRLSLREAVRALVAVGVLKTRQGSGTYVTDLRPDKIVQILGGLLELAHDTHILELFECRCILEAGATAQAATRISDAQLDDLRVQIDKMEASDDPERNITDDLAFHQKIVEAAGNPTLTSLVNIVAQRTVRARVWSGIVDHDALTVANEQHRSILAALAARDSMAAYSAAALHIRSVERRVRDHLHVPKQR